MLAGDEQDDDDAKLADELQEIADALTVVGRVLREIEAKLTRRLEGDRLDGH